MVLHTYVHDYVYVDVCKKVKNNVYQKSTYYKCTKFFRYVTLCHAVYKLYNIIYVVVS